MAASLASAWTLPSFLASKHPLLKGGVWSRTETKVILACGAGKGRRKALSSRLRLAAALPTLP